LSFDLTFTMDPGLRGRRPGGGLPPVPENPRPIDPEALTIFTAMQEQLGLRLESARGPVDLVVIDSIEPATEN
jgi:bla regulator protein blaR1